MAGLLTACSSTNSTSRHGERFVDTADPGVRLPGPHRGDAHIGDHRQRHDPVGRAVHRRGRGHRGLRRLCELAGRGQRPQDRGVERRRPVPGRAQQAGGPERHPVRLRQRGRALPRGQLQRAADRSQSRVPRHHARRSTRPPRSSRTTSARHPASNGWPTGPLLYFKQKYPTKIAHTATIIADLPSTELAWGSEKNAMQHLGYSVLYDPALPATTTDFTPQVVAMKSAGVQILFLEQEPQNYASAIFRDLAQQNFHPVVVLGAARLQHAARQQRRRTRMRSTGPTWSRRRRSTWARTRPRSRRSPPSTPGSRRSRRGSRPTSSPSPGGCAVSCSSTRCATPARTRVGASLLQALRKITAFDSGNLHPGEQPGRQGADHLLPAGQDRAMASSNDSTTRRSLARPMDSAATGPTTGRSEGAARDRRRTVRSVRIRNRRRSIC